MTSPDSSPFFSRNSAPVPDQPLAVSGRFSRLSFIGWFAFLQIIAFFSSIALGLFSGIFNMATMSLDSQFVNALTGIAGLGYIVLLVLYVYFYIVIVARRLHDLNKSGWLMLLSLIPLLNILLMIYLLLGAGTAGNNRYGAPRPAAFWEKLLAWLMIILTALSIFAAGSIISFMMGAGQIETPQQAIEKGTEYF